MTNTLTIVAETTTQIDQTQLANRDDVVELSNFEPNREGRAVRLSSLMLELGVSGNELVLSSSSDGFSATLPFADAVEVGLLWFANSSGPLTSEQGGPFRFLIPNAAECKTAMLDSCANVKFVDRIEVRS